MPNFIRIGEKMIDADQVAIIEPLTEHNSLGLPDYLKETCTHFALGPKRSLVMCLTAAEFADFKAAVGDKPKPEWQIRVEGHWVYGIKIRGVVRKAIAAVCWNEFAPEWECQLDVEGRHLGECRGSFEDVVSWVEDAVDGMGLAE